jgi:AraC family transcriptional regulator
VAERELLKSDWIAYFEEFTKRKHFRQAEQAWIESLSYDHRTDIFELSLENRQYLIHRPKSIFVDEACGTLTRFKIVDDDNFRHIIQLYKPQGLRLSPAVLHKLDEAKAESCSDATPAHNDNVDHRLVAAAIVHHLEQADQALATDIESSQSHIHAARALLRPRKETPERQQRDPAALVPWRLRCVTEHIQNHLSGPIQVAELANKLRLSKSYFSREFCKATGMPPRQYVIHKRLERAQELLLQDRRPISQIAVECGFADQAHMTRLFTRAYGISPGLWRKNRLTSVNLESIDS